MSQIAGVGYVRLPNNCVGIAFRKANNFADITGLSIDSSDYLTIGSSAFAGLKVYGLTNSYAVVTNGSGVLSSLQYTDQNTASTLVARDGSNTTQLSRIATTGASFTISPVSGRVPIEISTGQFGTGGYVELITDQIQWIDGTTNGTRIYFTAAQASTIQVDPASEDASASWAIQWRTTNRIKIDATGIGFFNTTPAAKPTISGARTGNPALASLLTGLATLGLVTDSSSAGEESFTDITRVQTTDATETTLVTYAIPTGSTVVELQVTVVGYRTGGSSGIGLVGDVSVERRRIACKRVGGGAVIVGTPDAIGTDDFDDVTWAGISTIVASGNNVLVKVTGKANANIDWDADVQAFVVPR